MFGWFVVEVVFNNVVLGFKLGVIDEWFVLII